MGAALDTCGSSCGRSIAQEKEEWNLAREPCPRSVFVACQFNKCTEELLRTASDGFSPEIDIKASMPRFNLKGTARLPEHAEQFDVPAYGLKVTDAILELFAIKGIDTVAKQLGCRIPQRSLNLVVKEKYCNKYSEKVIAAVEGSPPQDASKLKSHEEAIEKLKSFARELGNLSPDTEHARSWSTWRAFVQKFVVNKDWEGMLHNKEVLKNFGFEGDVAELLVEENAVALNWLSKALQCFSLPGSMSDVVNLAFAMTNTHVPPGAPPAEDQIIAVLTSLRRAIENSKDELWRPTVFIQDAELDDLACWLLLEHVSQGKQLDVHLQLPLLEAGDSRFQALDAAHSKYQRICKQVFRDPDSSNVDPILAALS